MKTNTKTSKQIKCILTPSCASAVCVYSRRQPAGSTTADLAKPAMQPPESIAFLPDFPAVQGAKACFLSLGPCPPQALQMVKLPFPKRYHMGALPAILSGLQNLPAHGDLSCTPPLLRCQSFFNLLQCQNGQSSGSPAVPSTALGAENSSSLLRGQLWCYSLFQPDAWLELQ